MKSASEWAREMAELQKVKPRPLLKWYRNPTPEQAAEHNAKIRAWNVLYRKASKEQKLALVRDNETYRLMQLANKNPRRKTRKIARIRRNPRGNYTDAEKKSIKRHTRKSIKRSGIAVRRMVSTAKRLTRISRNPKPPARRYIIEALVRDGQKLHYRFWTGEGNKSRALLTDRMKAKAFHSQADASTTARRLLPFCSSRIISLRVVPR
jgi:hypothetical protein